LDVNRDAMVMVQLDGVRDKVEPLWRGSNAGEVARLARRIEERGPQKEDSVVRVPDVMVMGRRRLPWSGHCRMEVKEFTVVAAGCDVLGAQLDDAELMVDTDVEGVEGALTVWWRQWTWRCCHGGSVSRQR
jgi:hypothetical protein